MRTSRCVAFVALAAAAVTTTVSGCGASSPHFHAVPAPQVRLVADGAHVPVHLGVLVSATSPVGEGADLLGAAAGARVAEYRLAQGGVDVRLDVVDDKGTAAGARAAVHDLVAGGVSGIVALTTGTHLDDALRDAAAAHVAVVLPYAHRVVSGATTAWYTGPTGAQVATGLSSLLAAQGLTHPFVLVGDHAGDEVAGVASGTADTATIAGAGVATDAIAPVVAAAGAHRADSVVVAASSRTQAAVVAQLQGRLASLPVVLTPDALAPAFGKALAARRDADASATPAGRFLTVGAATGDASAQGTSAAAVALTAFLSADRLAARDGRTEALTHAVPFGQEGAATADVASHDAVVVLARAVMRAASPSPADVVTSLGRLHLGNADGLAGPSLDLTRHEAFDARALTPLASTTQDPGLRAGVDEPLSPLTWFALPASG